MKRRVIQCAMLAAAFTAAVSFTAYGQSAERQPRPRSRSSSSSSSIQQTTSSKHDTTSSVAVHVGKLSPASESRNISKQQEGIHTIAGTDVQVGYHIGETAGWYEFQNGILSWRDPVARETNYITISVQDAADKRIIPGCKVTISLAGPSNQEVVSSTTLAFRWDTQFYHYGSNIALPKDAPSLTLYVRVDPPEFSRLGHKAGAFFTQSVTTSWTGVKVSGRTETTEPAPPTTKAPEQGIFTEGRHPVVEPTPYPGAKKP